jgi:hypothetical protein
MAGNFMSERYSKNFLLPVQCSFTVQIQRAVVRWDEILRERISIGGGRMVRWPGRTLALALDVYKHITQLKSDVSFGLTGLIASNCAFNGDDRNARWLPATR